MRGFRGRAGLLLVAAACAAVWVLTGAAPAQHGSTAAAAGSKPIEGDTPPVVAHGQAALHGHHNPNEVFRLNVGLAVRDSAGLDALIKAAGTPGNPQYGHYLTNAQYLARYAPTAADVQAVRSWLTGQGLTVTGLSPDNLLVHVQATAKDAERAFGVVVNDYTYQGRTFHSNDRDPSVPADLDVSWVSGLSNFDVFEPADTCTAPPSSGCSFDGGDLRGAYDIIGNGQGQTIGFTLWGGSLPQSDYTSYATATGTTALTIGQAGDDGLNFIQVDGAGTNSANTDGEIALDTQNAHGVAPGIHETYWLGEDNSYGTLEDVLNTAANSSISIISNSWGKQANPCSVDSNMETSLQHGAATGKTFYFSTGDGGASVGCEYPAESQYVVAVGGTALTINDPGDVYGGESAVNNGGGCLASEPRPSWQTGIGTPQSWGTPPTNCSGRATPDVAAISGFCTDGSNCGPGTFVFFDGSASCCFGGTSLATPIWAAASVLWNKQNAGSGRPGIGFSAPLVYALANDPTTYANDFHDVTTGTNGFAATTGWDEATGWGSADFNKLMNNLADVTYTGPTHANQGDTIALSGSLLDKNASTTLATAALGTLKLSFAADGANCDANVDSSGNASCNVTISSAPGVYKAIAAYAGDAAYQGGSQTVDFTVLHIPTKITYSGATSSDYNDTVTLSATLVDDGDPTSFERGDGIASETLKFDLGGESCSAVTDANGFASCSVTPLDDPGSYSAKVTFVGDSPVYNASSSSTPFTLNQEESGLAYTGPSTAHYHDAFTPSARLTDPPGGTPIAGKKVTFTLGGTESCSANTAGDGTASCTITSNQTGTQSLVASFAGDVDYVPATATTSFSLTPEETTMSYTGPTVILAGAAGATLKAKLVEDGPADTDADGGSPGPVPAEQVTLSVGSQSCTDTTDSAGNVSCQIASVTVPLGPETVSASFAGDAFYQASTATATAIVFAFPSAGVFTLGDLTVAAADPSTTVTWWSNNWYLLNTLSGGTAPSPFKGFVGVVTLPTTTPANVCSGTWGTTGGNSPPPPPTVPSYMGVIVATKITKPRNTLNGNYVKIVVVKTNPGYAPGPQNAGTGTIVATFCG
jgi:Pro-kumamolisin, activation domain/Bacterial Ig-like domain (group 3)/Subtilase family